MESPFEVTNQVGPCGLTCGTCFLGIGSVANSAKTTLDYINVIGIKEWAPLVPEGAALDWEDTEKMLNWMTKYACTARGVNTAEARHTVPSGSAPQREPTISAMPVANLRTARSLIGSEKALRG